MVTAMYPEPNNPHSGTFVRSQVDSLAAIGLHPSLLHLTGRSPGKYARGMTQVYRLADPTRFDLIHGHYGFCGIVARAQRRVPVVVSFCGDDLLGTPDSRGKPTLAGRLVVVSSMILAHVVDGIIVKSDEMRGILPRGSSVPIAVIPNGVDFDLFRPVPRKEARDRLGLDSRRRYAVFPADPAIPRKRFAIVEAAVHQLAGSGTPIELLAVHGRPQSAVVDFYNAADVVVLPSLWEGSPNVIKEAMACGVPIVATDVGDVREVIGRTAGCHVVDRTSDAFAAAIHSALSVAGGRTSGRQDVAHLSLESAAFKVRDLYAAALDHRRAMGSRANKATQ